MLDRLAVTLRRAYWIRHWDADDYYGVVVDAWLIARGQYPAATASQGLIYCIARRIISRQLGVEGKHKVVHIEDESIITELARRTYLSWYGEDEDSH